MHTSRTRHRLQLSASWKSSPTPHRAADRALNWGRLRPLHKVQEGGKLSIICIVAASTSAVGTGTAAVDHGSARGVVQLDALFPRLNRASTYVTVLCNGHTSNQIKSDAQCMSFGAYTACGTAPVVSGAHFAFAACTAQKTYPLSL